MILATELSNLDSEIAQLQALIESKRQQQEVLSAAENIASEALARLGEALYKIEEVAPSAIASLKIAVLGLFADDGNDDGGNQPTTPTPDTDPTPGADEKPPTYAQAIKARATACLGYEIASKSDLKHAFINRCHITPMEGIWLDQHGQDFYNHCENLLDKYFYNGQTCEWASPFASPVSFDDTKHPSLLNAGSRFWHGAKSSTGTVIQALGDNEYLCQIDGAVGEVALERHRLHYVPSSLEGQQCDIDKAPLLGQHCSVSFEKPYVELVNVGDRLAYQRKHDGEIICSYFGFRTKAIAQSWKHFFEAITSKVELREAKRLEKCRWEIKANGLSIKQIERYAKECDFSKSYRSEICSSKPPGYKKPEPPQPVIPDEVEAGDIVTPLLTPGDSYEVIQVMPNGILDCKSLRTGVQMGMRPTAVSLVSKASKYPPCPFNEGDLVDWKGCILRVAASGVETLHCVLRSDPDGTKPHTRVAIAECSMVDDF